MAEAIHTGYLPPPAYALRSAPHCTLPRVLFRHASGGIRAHYDATYLAELIRAGIVLVDDLEFLIAGTPLANPRKLVSQPQGFEGEAHRVLKRIARSLAYSIDPNGAVANEVLLASHGWRIRPDVVGLGQLGAIAFEVGAEDGRDIAAMLEVCFRYVVLIPFANPQDGAYRCYSFRGKNTPPLPHQVLAQGYQS